MTGFADMLRRIARAARQERPSDADLHDLGLSRADFEILTGGLPGARDRLVAMAATFGLSEQDIDRERGIAQSLWANYAVGLYFTHATEAADAPACQSEEIHHDPQGWIMAESTDPLQADGHARGEERY